MPIKKLRAFLDEQNIKYVTIGHSIAYTAQEIAASAHVSGSQLAKVVVVTIDGKDAMVVVPATVKVNLDRLKSETGASQVELTGESKFQSEFPGCELGAMPPFGNLFDMDVYVSSDIAKQDQITFNAGTHSELIQLAYSDFEKIVKPKEISLHS